MRKVLVTISYAVAPAKREAYLSHVREMREHARDVLGLEYLVYENVDHPNAFVEVFACESKEAYEALDERQDDTFRDLVARLDRFTDLESVRYEAVEQLP